MARELPASVKMTQHGKTFKFTAAPTGSTFAIEVPSGARVFVAGKVTGGSGTLATAAIDGSPCQFFLAGTQVTGATLTVAAAKLFSPITPPWINAGIALDKIGDYAMPGGTFTFLYGGTGTIDVEVQVSYL